MKPKAKPQKRRKPWDLDLEVRVLMVQITAKVERKPRKKLTLKLSIL